MRTLTFFFDLDKGKDNSIRFETKGVTKMQIWLDVVRVMMVGKMMSSQNMIPANLGKRWTS